jgi:hypothetical protein
MGSYSEKMLIRYVRSIYNPFEFLCKTLNVFLQHQNIHMRRTIYVHTRIAIALACLVYKKGLSVDRPFSYVKCRHDNDITEDQHYNDSDNEEG